MPWPRQPRPIYDLLQNGAEKGDQYIEVYEYDLNGGLKGGTMMTAPLLSSGSFYSRICHEQEEATGGRTRDQHDECRRRTRKKSAPLALTDGRYSGCCIAMSVVGWNQAQLLKQRQRATRTQSSMILPSAIR